MSFGYSQSEVVLNSRVTKILLYEIIQLITTLMHFGLYFLICVSIRTTSLGVYYIFLAIYLGYPPINKN